MRSTAVILVAVGMLVAAGPAPARASTAVRPCGFIHASVPYSHTGRRYRWRTYVRGSASCQSATAVLNAVTHLHARAHVGSDDANSYFSFQGWRCSFGLMGGQPCWQPAHRPYRSAALALNCSIASSGCPADVPADYLPQGHGFTGAHAAAATPRLLGFPCGFDQPCRQRPMYRPQTFYLGSHYEFEQTRWTQWNQFGASAQTTLSSEYQGAKRRVRTTVVFSDPKRMCGILTFTEWHAGSGDSATLYRSGSSCFFVIQ
jgi:hypothetical protein